MKIFLQTDQFDLFEEALNSNCDGVRFGSEFCELMTPCLDSLKKAYELTMDKEKEFIFITPRLSKSGLRMIKEHLDFLNGKEETRVIFNDLGLLNLLVKYNNLKPHMGRQLIYAPARCPWPEIAEGGFFTR